ncbi:MAG: hypothetical protein AABX38_01760 [Candidatus Micrarchaeota archaeon]
MKNAIYDSCTITTKRFYCDVKIKNCRFIGVGKPVKEEIIEQERELEEKRRLGPKKYKELQLEREKSAEQLKKWFATRKKTRSTVFVDLKENPKFRITDKKGIRYKAKIKKLTKTKLILELVKDKKISWGNLTTWLKKKKSSNISI